MPQSAAADPTHHASDLGPLAWVAPEIKRGLESAVKSLRRFLRDAEAAGQADVELADTTALRAARAQLHQVAGALDMVGREHVGLLVRGMEAVVQRYLQHPATCGEEGIATIERASFAIGEYIDALLAGKQVESVGLFPQYAEVQQLAGASRVHPADLWQPAVDEAFPQTGVAAEPIAYGPAARAQFDAAVLRLVKGDTGAAQTLRDLCLGLAAGQGESPREQAFWRVCAGFFEAQAHGLLASDLYVRRIASRVLTQYAALARGQAPVSHELLHDLLFFCAHARVSAGPEPLLALQAVRSAWHMQGAPASSYEERRFGRFEPAQLAQARKRIAAAVETWSALAGGDRNRLKVVGDQFSLVADSLRRLHPQSAPLAQALTQVVEGTVRSGEPPATATAMEVATAILYLQSAYEELDTTDQVMAERATSLAARLERARGAAVPEPLAAWMEELYRRVSDRQTMGSVVDELRSTLREAEEALDHFFRTPNERGALAPVPRHLAQMRGVLSVLGLDQAVRAVAHMRAVIEQWLADAAPVSDSERQTVFERLGNSLGALGFLVDMLSYQPMLARRLFTFDAERGELRMVGSERAPRPAPVMDAPPPTVPAEMPQGEPAPIAPVTEAAPSPSLASLHAPVLLEASPDAGPPRGEPPLPLPQENAAPAPDVAAPVQDALPPLATEAPIAAAPREPALAAPAAVPEPTPTSAVEADDDDAELRDIFLNEAREVVHNGLASVDALDANPADMSEQTTVRRAFHTLKGSARMVQLDRFGEAAWAMEQLTNAWLAEQQPMPAAHRSLARAALAGFGRWVEAIAAGDDTAWQSEPFRAAADALRTGGAPVALVLPGQAESTVPAEDTTADFAPTQMFDEAVPPEAEAPIELFPEFDLLTEADLAPAPLAPFPAPESAQQESAPLAFELQLPPVADAAPTASPAEPDAPAPAAGLQADEVDFAEFATLTAQAAAPEPGSVTSDMPDVADVPDMPDAPLAGEEAVAPTFAPAAAWADTVVPDFVPTQLTDPLPTELPPHDTTLEFAPFALAPEPVFQETHPMEALPDAAPVDTPVSERDLLASIDYPATPTEDALPAVPGWSDTMPMRGEGGVPTEPSDGEGESLENQAPLFLPAPAATETTDATGAEALDAAAVQQQPGEPEAVPEEAGSSHEALAFALDADRDAAPEGNGVPLPAADASPVSDDSQANGPAAAPEEPEIRTIGSLRISNGLYNVYLVEADAWSQRLLAELGAWAPEREQRAVPDAAVSLAHALGGSSATVGFLALSQLARALEHALQHVQGTGLATAHQAGVFVDAAEDIRHLLHQFAAGLLREPAPRLGRLLQAIANGEDEPAVPSAASFLRAPEFAEPQAAEPPPPAALPEAESNVEAEAAADLPNAAASPVLDEAAPAPAHEVDPAPAAVHDQPDAPAADHDLAAPRWRVPEPALDEDEDVAAFFAPTYPPRWHDELSFEVLPPGSEPASAPAAPVSAPDIEPLLDADTAPAAADGEPSDAADGAPMAPEPFEWAAPRSAATSEALTQATAAPLVEDDDDLDVVDSIDADLFPIFEEEAQELLPQLSASLRQWGARPEHLEPRGEVLRVLHTLKGSARLAGAMRLGELAHRFESVVEALGTEGVERTAVEGLLAHADTLATEFARLRQQAAAAPAAADDAAAAQASDEAAAGPGAAAGRVVSSFLAPAAQERTAGAMRPLTSPTVRVRSHTLDRLVDQAGEVMISRSRLEARLGQMQTAINELGGNLERLRRQLRDVEVQAETQMQSRLAQAKDTAAAFDPLEFDRFTRVQELTRMMAESVDDVATVQRNMQAAMQGTEDELIAQGRQARELQRDLLRTRMVEFEGIAERLYAVARQAAKETGKPIALDITGGAVEMDRGVLERMAPAFEHLLRNAVVHGIEEAAVREAAGKPATGAITIALQQEGNDVVVEMRDDGAGLDYDAIRARARARGLVPAGTKLSDAEAAQLIFSPGFSTAATVTELAGRGIGMDVVRSEVQAAGGRIETHSTTGAGTVFRLLLPLTTAITQVVMLRAGALTFAAPVPIVEVVRRVSAEELQAAYASQSFEHAGERFPFFWAGQVLDASSRSTEQASARSLAVVVIRSAQQRLALHVDEVLGKQEVVVKHLGPQLARLPGLSGLSVLPSGAVVAIYNPVALYNVHGERVRQRAAEQATAAAQAAAAAPAAAAGTEGPEGASIAGAEAGAPAAPPTLEPEAADAVPLVLVVDDSITVRRVTQRLLRRAGYRVALAADGLQALERLREERPAMVLSDIEMPRMDGFELLRNIRADAAWSTLPVVMITSRIASKHREHAMQLGASHYLGKPYPEDELLALVQQHTRKAAAAAA